MKPAIARQVGMQPAIAFIDLAAQQARIRDRLDAALRRVLAHGQYIMGPEVAEFEERLSAFCGAPHTVTCASGTDVLALALMALGVRRRDAVLIPSFTFAATAEVVPLLGAVPVFDTLQAAILLTKLDIFADEIQARQRAAERYHALLAGLVATPSLREEASSSWAQYTIRSPERTALRNRLAAAGVPTAVYYSRPLHLQTAYRDFPVAEGGCPIAERLATEVLSLPMHPYLDRATQEAIAEAVCATHAVADQ
jgi:dTDP-4-amino-4,6-dideoxygalactose transaminase